MNQPSDEGSRGVDPGDELRDDLKPIVDLDGPHTLVQRLVHVGLVTVVEEQRQEPKGVLQRAALRQRDGLDETFQGRNGVGRYHGGTQHGLCFRLSRQRLLLLLLPVEETRLKVHDCPSMPPFVPRRGGTKTL